MSQQEQDQVVVSGAAGLGAAVASESGGELGDLGAVQARGYWELVWRRFRRDKVAIASAVFIVLLLLTAFVGAPLAKHWVGHGPTDIFAAVPQVVELPSLLPAGPMTHFTNPYTGHHDVMVLGAANRLGQDEFLRLLYGARVSLEVALLSTIGVMIIGVILGASAGYFRGATDTVISRLTEITMAFPLLLFVIALAATVGPRLNEITLGVFPQGVVTLVLIFSIFGWFYPARIMDIGVALGGAIFTETVYQLPGLGRTAVIAIQNQDLAVLQGVVVFATIAILFFNLIVDLLYAWIDPRIRLS